MSQFGPGHTEFLREGYAVGSFIPGPDYLCVHASYYVANCVFATPEQAEVRAQWLRETCGQSNIIVRRVIREGRTAFRVAAQAALKD